MGAVIERKNAMSKWEELSQQDNLLEIDFLLLFYIMA